MDLLLKESSRTEIQLQAVRIVHLLLHCRSGHIAIQSGLDFLYMRCASLQPLIGSTQPPIRLILALYGRASTPSMKTSFDVGVIFGESLDGGNLTGFIMSRILALA